MLCLAGKRMDSEFVADVGNGNPDGEVFKFHISMSNVQKETVEIESLAAIHKESYKRMRHLIYQILFIFLLR